MRCSDYSVDQQRQLLGLARRAIEYGLVHDRRLSSADPGVAELVAPWLLAPAACFVTLTIDGQLRGCVGTLEADECLRDAVLFYAHAAAFGDSRFAPLNPLELESIRIEISVLSPMQPLEVADEADLLAQLRPGVDGLWLEEGRHRATFLPQVWDKLTDPACFVQQLKLKAGLAADYWSQGQQWQRYTVTAMEEAGPDDSPGG